MPTVCCAFKKITTEHKNIPRRKYEINIKSLFFLVCDIVAVRQKYANVGTHCSAHYPLFKVKRDDAFASSFLCDIVIEM